MKKILIASSLYFLASITHANNGEAITTFSNAATAALNFKSSRLVEEISLAFPSFTASGRKDLLDIYSSSKIIGNATKNNASLQTLVPSSSLTTSSSIGKDGITYYKVSGTAQLQWQKCTGNTCFPIANKQTIQVSGSVVSTHENGRPTFKVNSFSISGYQGMIQ